MQDAKQSDPTFPPMMTGVGVSVPDQPFVYAAGGARYGALEAGHVVWARNTSLMDWAIVLEPEVPLRQAMQMVPLALVAAGDCIGVLTPPQVGLMFRWPDTILVNGGAAGLVEMTASTTDLSEVPDWIVVRVTINLRADTRHEPGERPDLTSLDEEGCPDLTRNGMIESFSRHFKTWLHTWSSEGFQPVHSGWLQRAYGLNEDFSLNVNGQSVSGVFSGLDEDGNMLLKTEDGSMQLLTLADVLLSPVEAT